MLMVVFFLTCGHVYHCDFIPFKGILCCGEGLSRLDRQIFGEALLRFENFVFG